MKKDFKILFIYPNLQMSTLVPIHVSVLSSCLKKEGFSVDLFDTTYYKTEDLSFDERKVDLLQVKKFSLEERGVKYLSSDPYKDLAKKVRAYDPDLIAITIVEDTYSLASSLLEAIKDFDIPVIAGGVFVSFSPDDVIKNDNIDIICVGEGEEPMVELCERMREGKDYSNIKNLWIKRSGKIVKNPMRKAIDINALPFIDYDIFERSRLYRPMYGKIYTMVHVELDRGCPYECTYCESPQLTRLYKDETLGAYYRRKTTDTIIAEMRHLKEKYKPDYVNFNSEAFLAKPAAQLEEFAARYRDEVGLPFWCQSRPETVTDEKMGIMKNAGCCNLQFGIEQGNDEFRARVLRRRCSNAQMVDAMKAVERYGIPYTVNNIIGFPDETRDLIFDTIELNRQMNPTTMNCYIFAPYKGTYLHRYCLEKGYIDDGSKVHQLLDGARLKMDSISYEELKGLQRTFSLYAKMPKDEWSMIRVAERLDEEGNRMFAKLRDIYYERYFK